MRKRRPTADNDAVGTIVGISELSFGSVELNSSPAGIFIKDLLYFTVYARDECLSCHLHHVPQKQCIRWDVWHRGLPVWNCSGDLVSVGPISELPARISRHVLWCTVVAGAILPLKNSTIFFRSTTACCLLLPGVPPAHVWPTRSGEYSLTSASNIGLIGRYAARQLRCALRLDTQSGINPDTVAGH